MAIASGVLDSVAAEMPLGLVYLDPRCHTDGLLASYVGGSGVLTLSCVTCHDTILRIVVGGLGRSYVAA